MSVPVYRIESSISEEEYSEPQLPLFLPRYVIESSSSEEVPEVRPQPRSNLSPPREHYLPRYEIESSTSEEAIDMPREGVNEILRGEVERILFIAPGHHMGELLGDDSYAFEVEEGSVEMHCSLLFRFLVEMVRKVLHLTLIFLDRAEEMAVCFANTLFMAASATR